jgi:very-short-patch-repair endonuclease
MSVERAKTLRKQMTDAEQRLWYRLRAHRFQRLKFKRQVPIGPYVADFANLRAKIVIEIDGGQHDESQKDKIRDRFLSGRGFRVLRFWNSDVLRSTEEVLEVISTAVQSAKQAPSPSSALRASPPSPGWGEGK